MSDNTEFQFDTSLAPAAERADSDAEPTSAETAESGSTDGGFPSQTAHGSATEFGVVAALNATTAAPMTQESPSGGHELLLLGAALTTYETSSLSTLIKLADDDPDPPPHVVAVLPFARQLVDQYGF
jgi:hypothetical protein